MLAEQRKRFIGKRVVVLFAALFNVFHKRVAAIALLYALHPQRIIDIEILRFREQFSRAVDNNIQVARNIAHSGEHIIKRSAAAHHIQNACVKLKVGLLVVYKLLCTLEQRTHFVRPYLRAVCNLGQLHLGQSSAVDKIRRQLRIISQLRCIGKIQSIGLGVALVCGKHIDIADLAVHFYARIYQHIWLAVGAKIVYKL